MRTVAAQSDASSIAAERWSRSSAGAVRHAASTSDAAASREWGFIRSLPVQLEGGLRRIGGRQGPALHVPAIDVLAHGLEREADVADRDRRDVLVRLHLEH